MPIVCEGIGGEDETIDRSPVRVAPAVQKTAGVFLFRVRASGGPVRLSLRLLLLYRAGWRSVIVGAGLRSHITSHRAAYRSANECSHDYGQPGIRFFSIRHVGISHGLITD